MNKCTATAAVILTGLLALMALPGSVWGDGHRSRSSDARYVLVESDKYYQVVFDQQTGRTYRTYLKSDARVELIDPLKAITVERPLTHTKDRLSVRFDISSPEKSCLTLLVALHTGNKATFKQCLAPTLLQKHNLDFDWWFAGLQREWASLTVPTFLKTKTKFRFGQYGSSHKLDLVQ